MFREKDYCRVRPLACECAAVQVAVMDGWEHGEAASDHRVVFVPAVKFQNHGRHGS